MTTHVAVMFLGRIVEMDTSEKVFQTPQHPYTQLLLSSTLSVEQGAGVPDLNVDADARRAMRDHPSYVTQRV